MKYICMEDIENLAAQGKKELVVDENTVLMNLARDMARQLGITIVDGSRPAPVKVPPPSVPSAPAKVTPPSGSSTQTKTASPVASAPAAREEDDHQRSSPLVRKIAREHNVNLSQVSGTGLGGAAEIVEHHQRNRRLPRH